MNRELRVGISACLLGRNVRYDGGNSLDRLLRDTFGRYLKWVPVCPEVECGLPVPREPVIVRVRDEKPCLIARYSGVDYTERFKVWITEKLKELQGLNLSGFVLKSRSPSCGLNDTKIYRETGEIMMGSGLFAMELKRRLPLMPVITNLGLYRCSMMEEFFKRVLLYSRLKGFSKRKNPGERVPRGLYL